MSITIISGRFVWLISALDQLALFQCCGDRSDGHRYAATVEAPSVDNAAYTQPVLPWSRCVLKEHTDFTYAFILNFGNVQHNKCPISWQTPRGRDTVAVQVESDALQLADGPESWNPGRKCHSSVDHYQNKTATTGDREAEADREEKQGNVFLLVIWNVVWLELQTRSYELRPISAAVFVLI